MVMKFREEVGRVNGRGSIGSTGAVHLENPESHLRWYFKYFLGNAHQNYWGRQSDRSLFLLSIIICKPEQQYRAILWAKKGIERVCLPYTRGKSAVSICNNFTSLKVEKGPREIKSPDIMHDLLKIEEQEGAINFKFGILYKRKGQRTDNEILCNNATGPEFDKFLQLLGEKITLKGFSGFKGGLDVRNNTTGEITYCTKLVGKEIIFHISTLLPYTPDNPQQVERKRHIGNDIVNIVFQEDEDDFDPCWFTSKMSHIFALVTYKKEKDCYLLRIFNEENVRSYEPEISPEYFDHEHFRHLLLVKLMNAEKAVYETPEFISRNERTNEQLLSDIYISYVKEDGNDTNQLRPFTELTDRIIETTPRIGRKKRSQKDAIFQEKGQNLKFQKIISGKAPTSKTSTSPLMHRKYTHSTSWKHEKVVWDYPSKIVCADFWGSYILIGTDTGLALIDTDTAGTESGATAEICDKNFIPKHIIVVEEHSIVIVRAEKGKKKTSCLYIFNLSDITMKSQTTRNYKRKTKQGRLDGSKGAHLISHILDNKNLFMAVAYKSTVSLYEWTIVRGQGQGWFNKTKEFAVADVQCITLFLRLSGKKICVGTPDDFRIVDVESRCIESLLKHKENSTLCITPVMKNDTTIWAEGVLLTYNNISVIEQFTLHPSNVFVAFIRWHIISHQIHCALPYFIAVGAEGIEMRLASNGSIVHSLELNGINYLSYKNPAIYFSIWHQEKCDILFMPTSMCGTGSTSTINSANTTPSINNESTEVPLRTSMHRDSPNRRSFNGARISNMLCIDVDGMRHAFSTVDLAFGSNSSPDDSPEDSPEDRPETPELNIIINVPDS